MIARQSTAKTVMIGPVLDASGVAVTDGVVADLKISKNGALPAALNASATLTHRHTGFYSLALTATDLDTVGLAQITIDDTVNSCGMVNFDVVEEVVYDALYAAAAPGYLQPTVAGRTLDVSVGGEAGLDWANVGSPTTAVNLSGTTVNLTNTVTTLTNLPAITANWLTAAGIADGAIDRATFAADTGLQSARSSTAQAGAAGTITLDASASATTDFYVGMWIYLTGGTGVGQVRVCTAYNGTTKVATISPNWATNPDSTSTFAVLTAGQVTGVTGSVGSISGITFPTNFSVLGINASGHITRVVLADTVTTLTNLPAITANWLTATGIAADAITDAKVAADVTIASVTGSVGSVTGAVGSVTGAVGSVASGGINRATFAADTGLQSARSNTAQAGAAGTITLDASASATTDFYVGMWIYLTGGTGVGQARVCTAYNGTTKVATIAPNWATNPDATSTFAVMTAGQVTGVQGNVTGSVASVTGAVGSVTGAVGSVTGNVGGNVVGSTASVTAAVTVGTINANVITATSIAADAITDAKVAADVTIASVTGAVGSVTGAVGSVAAGGITASSIADGAIDRATFAADTGLQSIRSNTAQAGAATTLTLDTGASASNNFYNNALLVLTGGTGIGQSRFITAYNGTTKVATVAAWTTTPDATTTFAIMAFDAVAGASAPTAAQNATAVWTDLLASSDFSTASSIGKLLKDNVDAAVTSRMATYTQPTGFLAATFPGGTVANTTNITAGTITTTTNLTNLPSIPANWITAAGIADAAIDRATFAADTGLQSIRSGTAQAGAATTITLDASASASNNFYNNALLLLTGGTGVGQARFITAYNGTTKVATVAAWTTAPDSTSTFAIMAFDAVAGASAPTAAQNATAVWTDLLASSDFSTASSVGKLLKDNVDAAITSRMATYTQPAGFLAATFPGGTIANTTNITGGTITTTTNLTNLPSIPANWLTAAGTAADTSTEIAAAVWDRVLTAATHDIASSAGRRLRETGAIVTSGTAQAGTAASITLAAAASATDGVYDPSMIRIVGGTGVGQSRLVIQYVGATRVASVDRDWRVTPDATSEYEIVSAHNLISTNEGLATGGSNTTITLNANASASNDAYVGQTVVLRTGTGQDQSRVVISYVGATKVATVGQPWGTNPVSGSGYIMWPTGRALVASFINDTITANAFANNAITAAKIADGAIDAATFAAGAINAAAIAADAITDAKVAADVTIASVTGSVGSISGVTFPTNFALLGINASGHISRVVLNDTTTTNTDAITVASIWTTALTESYRSANATGTGAQLFYECIAHLGESSISGTTKTLKKLDAATTAKTYTLNSATVPTSITETT